MGALGRSLLAGARQLSGEGAISTIGAGADGNIWVSAERRNEWATAVRMLRVAPDGVVTRFPLGLPPDAGVPALTAGPDGNVWFAIGRASRVAPEPAGIGKITPSGQVATFSTGAYFYNPRGIAAGSDGKPLDDRLGR